MACRAALNSRAGAPCVGAALPGGRVQFCLFLSQFGNLDVNVSILLSFESLCRLDKTYIQKRVMRLTRLEMYKLSLTDEEEVWCV